ncbi:hypothetical protein [Natronococcus jeotgali]|uniref:Transcriptional regulator n=1 Tax=Natronococcus jeotgali DSM 18795 TaxID=1227498 RepID=L9XPQ5_9EURY|nr:hypothetical protein [Natronococcus jeotgali]ELY63416.1 hypothetical protein C492_07250 [Natronococcus jeotgali DSM 18795]
MTADETPSIVDRNRLAPKSLTDRVDAVSVGDEITFNDREESYEVVETDRYSVTLSGLNDERITLSQNLQTGGWAVHEELWWVGPGDAED